MKNKLILVLCTLASCCFVACDYGTTPECKYHTITIDIPKKDKKINWVFDKDAREFVCHVDIEDITPFIYDFGNWSLCREYNKGTNNAYQVLLPMSQFKTDTIEAESTIYYTQHIDYLVGIGYIELQLTNSDHFYLEDETGKPVPPDTMDFRVQVGANVSPLTVYPTDWLFDYNARQFYCRVTAPDIPEEVFEGGQWSIHRVFNLKTEDLSKVYQMVLPLSYFYSETLRSTSFAYYTEHLDYRVGVGFVEIRLRNSDHIYAENILGQPIPPENMNFRLQLIY